MTPFWTSIRSRTAVLQNQLSIPVLTFPVMVDPTRIPDRATDPPYDVCIVGTPSPRRLRVYRRLAAMGLRLSPLNGVTLEDAAAKSRIVLNVHMHRCNHMEYPRIVGSFLSGAALKTPTCYGMDGEIPRELYVTSSYRGLAEATMALLDTPQKMDRMTRDAATWIRGEHAARCQAGWRELMASLRSTGLKVRSMFRSQQYTDRSQR